MANDKQRSLIAWLGTHHGDARVATALAVGWFRDAIAIASELGDADSKYFAVNVLQTTLMQVERA